MGRLDATRWIGVARQTYYHWCQKYGRIGVEQLKELERLRLKNKPLRKVVSERTLDKLAYNFARRLKTLSGLTPYEYICEIWTSEADRFILDSIHQMPGLNT